MYIYIYQRERKFEPSAFELSAGDIDSAPFYSYIYMCVCVCVHICVCVFAYICIYTYISARGSLSLPYASFLQVL